MRPTVDPRPPDRRRFDSLAVVDDFDDLIAANRAFAKIAGTKRLFLHSLETSFDYEWRGQTWKFAAKAPLPTEFKKFL